MTGSQQLHQALTANNLDLEAERDAGAPDLKDRLEATRRALELLDEIEPQAQPSGRAISHSGDTPTG